MPSPTPFRPFPVFKRQKLPLERPQLCGALSGALLLLCGCGLTEVSDDAAAQAGAVERKLAASRDLGRGPDLARVRLRAGPYVGVSAAPAARVPVPDALLEPDGVTIPVADDPDDAALAARIAAAAGLRVELVGAAPAPKGDGAADAGARARDWRSATGAEHLSADGAVWTGPLNVLLDAWTAARGYAWEPVVAEADAAGESAVRVVRRRTLLFRLHALSGDESYTASISTAGSGGDGGTQGGTNQSVSVSTDQGIWREVGDAVKGLLGPGGTLTATPSSGALLVSGLPADLSRVRAYLQYLNDEVLRPVTVSLHVYSLTLGRAAERGLGVTALVRDLLGAHNLVVSGGSVSLVRPVAAADSLSATVSALSTLGRVSRVLSADVPTLNNRPAAFHELVDRSYLARSASTLVEGTTRTELEPGTVSSGFAMSYVPRITGPDEVLVRLVATVQDTPEFRVFESGSPGQPGYARLELPEGGRRAVQVTQSIRRGETLLVTGFRDRAGETDRAGSLLPGLPLPEGRGTDRIARTEQLLLVQASVGAPLGLEVRDAEGLAL